MELARRDGRSKLVRCGSDRTHISVIFPPSRVVRTTKSRMFFRRRAQNYLHSQSKLRRRHSPYLAGTALVFSEATLRSIGWQSRLTISHALLPVWPLSGILPAMATLLEHLSLTPGHILRRRRSWRTRFGVIASMASRIARQRSSTVRAAALRSSALSPEKAFSIGLKSGL